MCWKTKTGHKLDYPLGKHESQILVKSGKNNKSMLVVQSHEYRTEFGVQGEQDTEVRTGYK